MIGNPISAAAASGAATLVLDVKWGRGAFRETVAEAHELAAALRQVARDSGVACEALITDMNQPLGRALGTASEVRAAIEILAGAGDPRLREVSVRLSEQAMVLRGIDAADARAETRPLISGVKTAAEHWVLAVDRVRYAGEPVAIVVARRRVRSGRPVFGFGVAVAMVLFAIGEALEGYTTGRARQAIKSLVELYRETGDRSREAVYLEMQQS